MTSGSGRKEGYESGSTTKIYRTLRKVGRMILRVVTESEGEGELLLQSYKRS
jgi:hypothetical protein